MEKEKNLLEEKKKTTLILTYNDILNYPSGIYNSKKNKIIVHSQDKRYHEKSPEKLSEILHSLYGKIELEKIDEAIIYTGLHALEGALYAASRIGKKSKNLTLVACDCDKEIKTQYAKDNNNTKIVWSECGGRKTLSNILEKLIKE